MSNVNASEVEKFAQMANQWWNPSGDLKTLHDINPTRLQFITNHLNIKDKKIADIGCGGGILSEALAHQGAQVFGIDLAEASLNAARQHAHNHPNAPQYHCITVEELAQKMPASFDAVVCMELLEHVPNPRSILSACTQLLKPQGWLFLSTLNRNKKSYLHAIIAAEHIFRMLPRGTHNFNQFITPSELSRMARVNGLFVRSINGMNFRPLHQDYVLSNDASVNYLMACKKQ